MQSAGLINGRTVIVCWQVDELPQASVARYVRTTIRLQDCVGLVSLTNVLVTAPPQLSEATTFVVFGGGNTDTVTFAGQVMLGGVVSFTAIVCVQVEALPQLSEATHLRVIVLLQLEFGFDCACVYVIVTVGSQLSVAVGATGAGTEP
jgi:hypothetical protein